MSQPASLPAQDGAHVTEVFDRSAIYASLGEDKELITELVGLFLEDYPSQAARIRDAVQQRDARALERAAHTLKGAVGNFAAHACFEAARRLEAIGRSGDLTGAPEGLAVLDAELARLAPALRAFAAE